MFPLSSGSTYPPSADAPVLAHHCGLFLGRALACNLDCIATLGPPGTSSEAAGRYLAHAFGEPAEERVALFGTYEDAARTVVSGAASRLLVANAYHGINTFYMEPRLTLEQAFVFDTAQYGLAVRPDTPLPVNVHAVTHPAPRDLIYQLAPAGYRVSMIQMVASTSAAAAQVSDGEADMALTTSAAARLYGLEFISRTRRIRMLWSVFVRSSALGADEVDVA